MNCFFVGKFGIKKCSEHYIYVSHMAVSVCTQRKVPVWSVTQYTTPTRSALWAPVLSYLLELLDPRSRRCDPKWGIHPDVSSGLRYEMRQVQNKNKANFLIYNNIHFTMMSEFRFLRLYSSIIVQHKTSENNNWRALVTFLHRVSISSRTQAANLISVYEESRMQVKN